MPDINNAHPVDLPSTKQLVRSTLIAAVIAAVLLVMVVLPAEYGVDPTGSGRLLGLTEMGEIKVALAREAAEPDKPAVNTAKPASTETTAVVPIPEAVASTAKSDETRITLKPGEGKEIKLEMVEGARVQYAWSTDRGVVNFDMHADSIDPPRDYFGYEKGSAVSSKKGELVAAFEGSHGWYWRNRSKQSLTVTLKTEGEYSALLERE